MWCYICYDKQRSRGFNCNQLSLYKTRVVVNRIFMQKLKNIKKNTWNSILNDNKPAEEENKKLFASPILTIKYKGNYKHINLHYCCSCLYFKSWNNTVPQLEQTKDRNRFSPQPLHYQILTSWNISLRRRNFAFKYNAILLQTPSNSLQNITTEHSSENFLQRTNSWFPATARSMPHTLE